MKSGLFGLIIAIFLILSLLLPNAVSASSYGEREAVVVLIDLKDSSSFRPKELKEFSGKTQKPVTDLLERNKGAVLNRFWLNNSILVRTSYKTILELRSLQDVEAIYPNFEVRLPPDDASFASALAGEQRPWGIDRIGAPALWAKGIKGSGVRIAVLDTGVNITHRDLTGKMWTDNLSDPTYPGGWIEFDEYGDIVKGSVPHDTDGHGTHTSGTALGGNAGGIAIGVAPEAKLMHALILPEGGGTFSQVIAGMQWAIEPFDQNGNPAGQPADVVSMSWGAGGYADEMLAVINKMREAGAIPVAAIGNGGEGSSGSPGNVYQAFAIGATSQSDTVASFSGGELVDWSQSYPQPYIKPDFSAPGVAVLSAAPGGGYRSLSGTSMAAPHVAGAIGLMLNSKTDLSAEQIYQVLAVTSTDKGSAGQDTRYGFGIINADKAVSALSSGISGSVTSAANGNLLKATISVKDGQGRIIFSAITDGNYLLYLLPGPYEITVDEFWHNSQTVTLQVQENAFAEHDFSLEPLPVATLQGKVSDADSGLAIEGARILIENSPAQPITDASGEYSVLLPANRTYNLKAYAGEYLPANRTIEFKSDTRVDFYLEPFLAAIMGDWNKQMYNLFKQNDFPAEAGDWDIVQNIANYNVVILNLPDDPGKETFLNFINSAQLAKVGLIFTSSYPGSNWPYGISLLQKYLDNPKEQDHEYGYGPVSYKTVFPHPIFKGLEQGPENSIVIVDGGDMDFAWFWNYSGIKAADISAEDLQPENGTGVAFDLSHGNSQLLLAGLAAQPWTGVRDWTDQGRAIFLNSVRWAGMKPAELALDKREAVVGERITLTGAGFTSLERLQIYRDNLLMTETETSNSGSFSLAITVPEMPADTYNLVALGSSSGKTGVAELSIKPSFTITPNSGKVDASGAKIAINGVGFGSKAEVKLYYNGSFFGIAAANELGSFSGNRDVPFVTLPGIQQVMAIDEKSNFGTASFIVTNDWIDNLNSSLAEIKNTLNSVNAKVARIDNGVAIIQTDTGFVRTNLRDLEIRAVRIEDKVVFAQSSIGNIQIGLENLNAKVTGVEKGVATIETELGTIKTDLKDIDANVAMISNDVVMLQTSLGMVKTSLKDLDAKVVTVKDNTVTIQTSLGIVQMGLNNLDAKVTGVDKGVATVQTELGAVKVNLKDIDANVAMISSDMVMIQTSLGIVKAGLKDIDAKVVTVKDNTVTIQTSLGVVQTGISNLDAKVIGVEKGVATIETELGVVKTGLKDIDADILQLRRSTVLLQTSLGTVQTGVDAINAKVARIDKGVAVIETDVGVLEGKVVKVQNSVSGGIAEIQTDVGTLRLEIKDADVKTNNRLDEILSKIEKNLYILLGFAVLSLATVVAVVYLKKK